MKISEKGLALLKRFEGCKLTAYKDCAGVWTIGYGTTDADRGITGKTIKSGLKISQSTADEWLRKSVAQKYEPKVRKYDPHFAWTQNEFDALVCFAYNLGHIDRLVHVDGDVDKALRTRGQIKSAWCLYCKDKTGRKVQGLLGRRKEELKLFCTPSGSTAKGNPYPSPVNTITSNEQATALKLLKWQNHGQEVKAVQWELVRLGYDIGKVDGVCGTKTITAIMCFQKGAGLKCDGACGKNTWTALAQAVCKPVPKDKAQTTNYMARMEKAGDSIYPLCIGKKHGSGVQKTVKTLEDFKKQDKLNCHLMVSLCLQEAGLLPKGKVITHTKKRSGKKKIADAVRGTENLKHCKVYWVNKRYSKLPKKWKKAGVAYIQNSNACISAGGGRIWSCNRSKGYRYRSKTDYYRSSGYPFSSKILVVIVPEH